MLVTILQVAGLICFLLAALGVTVPRVGLGWLGMFLFFLPAVL